MKERISNALKYMAVMFGSEVPAAIVFFLSIQIICSILGIKMIYDYRQAIPIMIISGVISVSVAVMIRTIFIRNNFMDYYILAEHRMIDSRASVKNFILTIFPGEVIRFLLSFLDFHPSKYGLHFLEGVFSFPADFYWYSTYLLPNGKVDSSQIEGFSFEDNLHFAYIYFFYLVCEMAFLAFVAYMLYKKYNSEHTHDLKKEPNYKEQDREIVKNLFYFDSKVTGLGIVKFAGLMIGAHVFTALLLLILNFTLNYWSALSGGDSLYLFRIIFTIPLIVIVPIVIVRRFMNGIVCHHISLVDENLQWINKALALILPGEGARFIVGLLPLAATRLGFLTSPLAYQIYFLGYCMPFGRIEQLEATQPLSTVDILIFVAIYLIYFVICDLLVFRRYKLCRDSQIKKLKGSLYERTKNK